jgi:hypothetical protein
VILNFRFWIESENSLSLWERARVRAQLIHTTLTSILSLQKEGEEVFGDGSARHNHKKRFPNMLDSTCFFSPTIQNPK